MKALLTRVEIPHFQNAEYEPIQNEEICVICHDILEDYYDQHT